MDLIQTYLKGQATEEQKDQLINELLKGINNSLIIARQISQSSKNDGGDLK